MTKPRIHDNGTSRESLAENYCAAWQSLGTAYEHLKKTAPNIRDYPELLQDAEFEHRARLLKIDEVIRDMDDLISHCYGESL